MAIDGLPSVGGLVGYNFGKIDFAYANGAVGGGINGGLVGSNDSRATITNSYWDTQLAGQGSACGVDVGTLCSAATGLSTLQTQFATNYAGWSLDNAGGQGQTWRIYDGLTTPLLKVFLRPLATSSISRNSSHPTSSIVALPSAICTAEWRIILPTSRSRFRTPASRV